MTVTPVERFLARPGTMVPVDDDGFLSAEFVERTSEPQAKSFGIRTWEELEHEPCIVLLGEPGSGKTRIFEEARARLAAPITARRVDLGRFGSGEHLEKSLAFAEWLNSAGASELHVFLDGLDECLVLIDKAARILLDLLKDIPQQDQKRLKLRIACRTGAWSPALASELSKIFPRTAHTARADERTSRKQAAGEENPGADSEFPIWELLPLRSSDAIAIASARASTRGKTFDPVEFLAAVRDASVGPLAARPKTLFYLVDLFLQHQTLPGVRWDIYKQALLHSCTEEAPFRAEEMPRDAWSPDERFLLMARIAAGLLLGNCTALRRTESSSTSKEELRVEDLAEDGVIPIGTRQATAAEVRLVLRKEPHPLQASEGELIRFTHRTEEEFLAAFYLTSQTKDVDKLWTVLCAGSDSIRPQLAELACWVASQSAPLRERIRLTNPEILLFGDLSTLADSERADLTKRILEACASRKLADRVGGWDNSLGRLKHSSLPQQILPWLTSGTDFVAQRVAIRLVRQCHPARNQWDETRVASANKLASASSPLSDEEAAPWSALIDRLIEMVLDEREDLSLRTAAAWALDSVADATQWEQLLPLVKGMPGDTDRDLHGIALIALTRRGVLSLSDALATVNEAPSSNYLGAYAHFIDSEIPRLLTPSELSFVLRWLGTLWAQEGVNGYGFEMHIGPAVLRAAWQHADQEPIQQELVTLLFTLFEHHITVPLDLSTVNAFPQIRRIIVERLIREAKNLGKSAVLIGPRLRSTNGLLRPEDLEWLLSWHRQETDADVQRSLREVIWWALLDFSRLDHTEALIIACEADPELERDFRILVPENLDDPKVIEKRRRARELAPQPKELIKPEPWIQQHLAASTPQPSRFHNLLYALALPPEGAHSDRNPFSGSLNDLPGWHAADDARREAIRDAALRFLIAISPDTEKWLGKKSFPSRALTGTKALMFLAERPERLHELPSSTLASWTPAFLSLGLDAQPQDWIDSVLAALMQRVPESIADTAVKLVSTDLSSSTRDSHTVEMVLGKSHRFWCAPLAEHIRSWVIAGTLPDKQDSAAFSAWVQQEPATATQIAWMRLEGITPPLEDLALAHAVNAAAILWELLTPGDFGRWWQLLSRDKQLAHTAVERVAHHQGWVENKRTNLNTLSAQDAEAWYRWLTQAYPPPSEDDSSSRFSYEMTPLDEVKDLRGSLLGMLTRRATDDDIAALERLDQDFPDSGFRWRVDEARVARRSHGWTGWSLGKLWSLLHPAPPPGTASRPAFDAARMRECMRSDAIKGVYLLGCFDRRVTLYAQQCRALNLIHALAELEELHSQTQVAVIGGGVGGLTAAAAARLAGASVTLYEARDRLLAVQREAAHRWIHPHIYEALEWPASDNSNLPILQWKAGAAPDVVNQLEKEFDKLASTLGGIDLRLGRHIAKVGRGTKKNVILIDQDDRLAEYDIVIVAIGFGKESSSAKAAIALPNGREFPTSYWAPDELAGELGNKRILISGSGDGALIDLARASIKGFSHATFVENLLKDSLYQPLRQQFLKLEDQLKKKDDIPLWTRYSEQIKPSQEVLASLRIRPDANVTFNASHYGFFDRGTALHNRLLAFLLLNAHRDGKRIVDRWLGRISKVEHAGLAHRVTLDPRTRHHESSLESVDSTGPAERAFDIVILRHGPAPSYFESSLPNLKDDVERQRKVLAQLDFSRHLEQSTRDYFQKKLSLSAKMAVS